MLYEMFSYIVRYKKHKHQEQSRNENLTTAIINGGLLTSDTLKISTDNIHWKIFDVFVTFRCVVYVKTQQ